MHIRDRSCGNGELSQALALMRAALDILDEVEAPGEIGSTLDLAISRLAEMLGDAASATGGAQPLLDQLERALSQSDSHRPDCPWPWEKP